MADAKQVKEAAEVYMYGYPLGYDLQEVANIPNAGHPQPLEAPGPVAEAVIAFAG